MDIAQTIRQRAQERGVDPELALAIAKAESGLRPQIKNPKSSAHGLFQIVDDTWKQYGGDPKKRKDVNENIRIGLEILADNQRALSSTLGRAPRPGELYAAHFFGKTGAQRVLTANPDAPISSVVSERVLKANPELLQGKSVYQALSALGAKVGDTGPGQRVPRAPDPKTARPTYREDPAKPPVISNAIDATNQYGPGYQAALALSYLADTEEESDDPDAPSVVEREARAEIEEQQQAAIPRGPRASDMLAQMDFGYAPVVGQPQAQAPVKMADGGLLQQAARLVPLSRDARNKYESARAQWEAFSKQGESYNAALNRYNREVMGPYSAQVAAYNKALDEWNAGPRTSDFTKAPPRPSSEFTMAAPKEPNTLSPEQMDNLMREAQKRRAMTAQALNVAADPSQFGLSMPALFNQGGEVMDPEAALFAGRGDVPAPRMTGRELAQQALYGVGDLPYVVAGAPVDLAAMVMAPFGYKDDKPFMGSADIKARMTRAGIRPADTTDPRLMGPRSAAELLASLTNPAGVTRGAARAVETGTRGAGEAAKMLEDVTVGNIQRARVAKAGERAKSIPDTAYDPLRERLEAQGNLALAVRPPGGNVPEKSLDFLSSSEVDRGLKKVPAERRDEIEEFIKTKGRKYFEKDFASTSDPLYAALKEGRIAPLSSSNAMMRQYMLNAARSGDPEALQDLSTAYDLGIKPRLVRKQGEHDALPYEERTRKEEAAVAAMRERFEQSPGAKDLTEAEKNLPSRYSAYTDQDMFEKYYTGRPLTEGELRGVEKGSPFYTFDGIHQLPDFVRPDKLAESFADIPPDRLKKMSYAEAAIEANRFARFREDYGSALSRVKEGKDVPKEIKLFGTTPVVDTPSGAWRRITDPAAADMEGAMMGHSVGGYSREGSYGHGGMEALKSGRAKVYTLRDNKGNARVTVEALDVPEGMMITQIKGKYNAGPLESEVQDVFKLFDSLESKKKIDRIFTESYLPKEKAPAGALTGTTEWQHLYNEYLLGKK